MGPVRAHDGYQNGEEVLVRYTLRHVSRRPDGKSAARIQVVVRTRLGAVLFTTEGKVEDVVALGHGTIPGEGEKIEGIERRGMREKIIARVS